MKSYKCSKEKLACSYRFGNLTCSILQT